MCCCVLESQYRALIFWMLEVELTESKYPILGDLPPLKPVVLLLQKKELSVNPWKSVWDCCNAQCYIQARTLKSLMEILIWEYVFSAHKNFHQQQITCLSNLAMVGCLYLFRGQLLCLKQKTPPWERTVENKSNIHMQAGRAVRLPFVFFSLVGWPFSREYQQDMLTLHDWDPGLNQSCGFRHGNTRNRRGGSWRNRLQSILGLFV